MTFGQWVRKARRAADLTQEDVGNRLGTSQGYVSSVERDDDRNVTRDTAKSFAAALGVPAKEALQAAGFAPDEKVITYITDPDIADMVEAYEGAADRDKELVKTLLAKAREMEKESSIGGKRSDRDENATGQ